MKLALQFFFLFTITIGFSQSLPLSQDATISVITIGPGHNLNDAFGHNAIRVKSRFSDITYDFGRYDFDAPNFYLNFARGKLNYLQGKSDYNRFVALYIREDRTVKEQELRLTFAQKQALNNYLETNYKKNQGAYLYDFFYDNCATKIRDAVEVTYDNNFTYNLPKDYQEQTFRQLIDGNLHWNTWGSFGIDIALGSIIDRTATQREQLFLPEYVNQNFETATLKDTKQPVVLNSKTIYTQKGINSNKTSTFITSPLLVLTIIAGIIVFITYTDNKNKTRSKGLDLTLFITTGVIGVLLFLLWFATDHTATAYNYNILWAFPLSVFCIPQLLKAVPKNWFIAYIKFSILMLCLMVMHWTIGVQRFAPALLPLLIALAIRYAYLLKYYKANRLQ